MKGKRYNDKIHFKVERADFAFTFMRSSGIDLHINDHIVCDISSDISSVCNS